MSPDNNAYIERIKLDEGLRLKPYKDTADPPKTTIGYGRNLDDKGITKEEAEFLFTNDCKEVIEGLERGIPWFRNLSQARQGVLVNMAFNLGVPGLLKWTNTLKAMERGDFDKAAAYMQGSLWRTQVGLRAARLIEQVRVG